jgi:hypothetical protein
MPRLFQKVGLHRFQTKRCLKQYIDETSRLSLRDFDSHRDYLYETRVLAFLTKSASALRES